MTRNSEYWEKRIAEGTWKEYNTLEERNRDLLDMYREASLNLSDELYKLTEKINGGKGVTISDMYKNNRLNILQKHFEGIIKDLTNKVQGFAEHNMYEGFENNYSNTMKQLGVLDFAIPNKKLMEELMERPWLGNNFSNRLWDNSKVLATNLNDILTTGLQQGKTIAEISINLSNIMQKSFNICHRLIRTETMHYLNQSSLKSYKDADVEYIEVWAALDERRCKVCGEKHAKVYKLKDAPIVPLHANCRCTILPVIDESWKSYSYKEREFKDKKEITNHLKSKYNIKLTDSRKYPIDKDILQDSVNWLDKFNNYFKGLEKINPVLLPAFKIKAGINSVGYYSYYQSKPEAVELVLNGLYFSDKQYNIDYIKRAIESKWTVPNAKGHKTFVHEYGHHIANSLKWLDIKSGKKVTGDWVTKFMNDVIDDYNKQYESDKQFKDMSEMISRYGGTKPVEAFAEVFAEYFGGDAPREFANVFGNKIEKELKKHIKNGVK